MIHYEKRMLGNVLVCNRDVNSRALSMVQKRNEEEYVLQMPKKGNISIKKRNDPKLT